ncbi:hypothetical protein ACFV3R_10885 [Streptomyces sp. NPDC059740]|uniref:hypothetical protein n=1 Tax=Streptomyces sp. NPDC059740 TaxID=3346926 RepID=UPI00365B8ECE
MSKSDFINAAAERVRDDAPLGSRTRGEIARFMAHAADDDGHIPEEPEARRAAVRIAEALEQDRDQAQKAGRTAWSRLNDLHRQQRDAAALVAKDLVEALQALYPAALALVLAEKHGAFVSARLVGARGCTVREFGLDTAPLPQLPARLRERWPEGALARVKELDDVIATLWACGIGFDDLPADLRGGADDTHYVPALLLTADQGCECGCD